MGVAVTVAGHADAGGAGTVREGERSPRPAAAKATEEIVAAEMAEVLPDGITPEQVVAETQALLDGEEEFALGDVEEDPVQFMEELSKEESARLVEEEVSHQESESLRLHSKKLKAGRGG